MLVPIAVPMRTYVISIGYRKTTHLEQGITFELRKLKENHIHGLVCYRIQFWNVLQARVDKGEEC